MNRAGEAHHVKLPVVTMGSCFRMPASVLVAEPLVQQSVNVPGKVVDGELCAWAHAVHLGSPT